MVSMAIAANLSVFRVSGATANARVRRLDLDRPQGAGGTPGPLSVRLVLDQ